MIMPSTALLMQALPSGDAAVISGGTGIAAAGMITVFGGLVCLSFLLPLLRKWAERPAGSDDIEAPGARPEEMRALGQEELAAVSAAIHAHMCFLDQLESMKLTLEDYEKPYSPWKLAGRTEHLQGMEMLQNRIRSR